MKYVKAVKYTIYVKPASRYGRNAAGWPRASGYMATILGPNLKHEYDIQQNSHAYTIQRAIALAMRRGAEKLLFFADRKDKIKQHRKGIY